MKIKLLVYFALLLGGLSLPQVASAQSALAYFNQAARQYVNSDYENLPTTLSEGLRKYPDDRKLNALKEKLEEEKEKQKENQQQQNKQQKQNNQDQQQDQNQQQQQQKDQKKDGQGEEQTQEDGAKESTKTDEKRGEKSNREEPVKEPSSQESDLSEREKAMEELRQKLQKMNISPEQATQILDAMNNSELKYIQQQRRKASKRPDSNLPDY
ncbi:hypothetical protein QWY93_16880 [Echinicola jeungdonensis]|uniref:Uncharacterized protein n=1 Tax=Echinicola jeungdonensis TaxID=709343 RepID=A0ABV5J5R0_9BACT|nr:hypothetical protein [Echinicola jeungdonensis]MDN3670991.1 hypothetical protein [Echinicola jeungdonensis]